MDVDLQAPNVPREYLPTPAPPPSEESSFHSAMSRLTEYRVAGETGARPKETGARPKETGARQR